MWALVRDHWFFSESEHQVGLWTCLDSFRQDYSWKCEMRWGYIFIRFCRTDVLHNLSIRSVRLITSGGDRHLQRMKGSAYPRWDESWVKFSLKRMWDEDRPVSEWEGWMGIPKPLSNLYVTPSFHHTHWI